MTNKNTEPSLGDGSNAQSLPGPPSLAPADDSSSQSQSCGGNKVYKSGPLFLSSRGIGWTSWKKRWFILTSTSLVFFRSDPNAIPQKGTEVNLTLGGIDLNSSGSVVVKADKKLLTVLFSDGHDGRTFTLKAETLEDLYEWQAALEDALKNAPSATPITGQNAVLKNDQVDGTDGSLEQSKDRQPVKSLVIGRPILLALEDIDGTPSFLEKALRFIEEHGVKVEGILRQAADVDDVERRIREYEWGKGEFSPEEDPHVIADCVKYVLRELPSSPVPASCCNALLEACRTDRSTRVTAVRSAICETFPEPNRRLLQRILMMMQAVASHKSENRMSTSAVAACMAPLLLRPLLAGDCELEHDFDMGSDGSVQLLQAAAAANHAQAIVITLLEEYNKIFGEEESVSPGFYTDSEESESEYTDDDESFEDNGEYDESEDYDEDDGDVDEDFEHRSSGTCRETGDVGGNNLYNRKGSEGSSSSVPKLHEVDSNLEVDQKLPSSPQNSIPQHDVLEVNGNFQNHGNISTMMQANEPKEKHGDDIAKMSSIEELTKKDPSACTEETSTMLNGPVPNIRQMTVWGRATAKKNLSTEPINLSSDDEAEVQRLKVAKTDLQNRIGQAVKGNATLQENLEKRKRALHERRLALERDVAQLQEQLQKEQELGKVLEAGLKMPQGSLPVSTSIDEKMKADLEEIAQTEADIVNLKQKADDLHVQLSQEQERNCGLANDSCNQTKQTQNYQVKREDMHKISEKAAAPHTFEKPTRNKDTQLYKVNNDKDLKQGPLPSPNKYPFQNRQSDSVCNSKPGGVPVTSASAEPGTGKPVPTNSRKSGTRSEAANSTTSALSKLTNRLNFLKERRSQIANELQNMDKGQISGQPNQNLEKGSECRQTPQFQASEGQSSETGKKSDTYELLPRPNKGILHCQPFQKSDKVKTSEGVGVSRLGRKITESLSDVD